MQKLYCYVDETGQDTQGKLFIVSVVIAEQAKDELLRLCEQFEKSSGKARLKWRQARYESRLEYLHQVFQDRRFRGVLRYSLFRHIANYDLAIPQAIVRAVHWHQPMQKYTTLVYIDALSKTKRVEYGRHLHRLGLPTRKIQGVAKEESNALIRLADAVAGFVRDALAGQDQKTTALFQSGKRCGALVAV